MVFLLLRKLIEWQTFFFSFPAVPAATGGGGNVADANDAAGPVRRVEAPGELRQVEQVRRHQFRPE